MRKLLVAAVMSLGMVAPTVGATDVASAGTSKGAFSWHVADELLETNVGSPPFAIAEAANGHHILLDGTGTFDGAAKTADGGGRFQHYAADGTLIAEGTFTAKRLISLQFYGCGGPGLPDNLCGGLAKLVVTLTPAGTDLELRAILWIDCLLGDKIPSDGAPARAEGIRLNVKGVINFNETHEHSGFTVFIPEG